MFSVLKLHLFAVNLDILTIKKDVLSLDIINTKPWLGISN
jgi:hypothetical protein